MIWQVGWRYSEAAGVWVGGRFLAVASQRNG